MDPLPLPPPIIIKRNSSKLYHVMHLGLSFLFIFMSFGVAQLFQTSSDHARSGAVALFIVYGVFSLSNLLLSSYLTQIFGLKLTLFLSSLTYVSFVAMNISYNKYALYTASALLGLGAALIWTAQGSYVLILAREHETLNMMGISSQLGYFNGLFNSIFAMNQTLGNVIAALLFYYKVKESRIFIVMSVVGALGSLSILFLKNVKQEQKEKRSVLSSVSLLINPRMLFIMPIICYVGLSWTYIYGSIPPLILNNSLKFFAFVCFGLTSALSSIFFGKLSDHFHKRLVILFIGCCSHLLIYILLFTIWFPPIDQTKVFIFLIITCWLGVGDAIFATQLYSVLGMFFTSDNTKRPSSDIFANVKFLQAGSCAIGFFYNNYFNFKIQTVVIASTLGFGMVMLIICHYGFYSLDSEEKTIDNSDKVYKAVPLDQQ